MKKATVGLIGALLVLMLSGSAWAQSGLRIDLGGNGFGFTIPMATPVYRPTHMPPIGLTPIIIQDIILTVLISDGAVIGGITIINHSIGATKDQVIIARTTIMDINEAINGIATVNTVVTIVGKVIIHANGGDKLIARRGGHEKVN